MRPATVDLILTAMDNSLISKCDYSLNCITIHIFGPIRNSNLEWMFQNVSQSKLFLVELDIHSNKDNQSPKTKD